MSLQKNCRRVLAAWLLSAGAVQAATLSGFVTDADSGEALTRVAIVVEGLQLAAISNTSAYYAVKQVPAGTHIVSASHAGYQTRWDTLRFDADEAVRLDLALVPKPVDLGEQVSVETDLIRLRVKPLQQMPALGEADLLRGLQLLPGIQAVADISSGLYVRGGGPDQTAILLKHVRRAAVDHVLHQQVIPGAQEGEERRRDGRHAAPGDQSVLGALKRGDPPMQHGVVRAVREPQVTHVVVLLAVVLEVRGLEHRSRDRAERPGRKRPLVDGAGVEARGTIVVGQGGSFQERVGTAAS